MSRSASTTATSDKEKLKSPPVFAGMFVLEYYQVFSRAEGDGSIDGKNQSKGEEKVSIKIQRHAPGIYLLNFPSANFRRSTSKSADLKLIFHIGSLLSRTTQEPKTTHLEFIYLS